MLCLFRANISQQSIFLEQNNCMVSKMCFIFVDEFVYLMSGHVTGRFSSSDWRRHVIPLNSSETDSFVEGVCRSGRSSRVT